MPRIASLKRLKREIQTRLRDETKARAESSAIVFAPHQDDETLGCGGTMILKCQAAAQLSCIFMTDGATSHKGLMDQDNLRRLRKSEALAATAVLGLSRERVTFLDFPDGRLSTHHTAAVDQVVALLERDNPDEVFVPYRYDGTPDHEATYQIVVDALNRSERRTRVLEYPVWFWNQWPWVPFRLEANRSTLILLGRLVAAQFGLELLREFKSGVFVGQVIDQKRQALAQHRSQMTGLPPGRPWPTLEDVSNGEFLNCFFQEFEVFRSSDCPALKTGRRKHENRRT